MLRWGLALLLAAAAGGAADAAERLFTLVSPAFKDDAVLPLKFAGGALCGVGSRGGNTSPPLAWSNPPAGTKSFALFMIDPDGRRGLGSVHWVAYGIPASRSALRAGEGSAESRSITQGKNSRGSLGYAGPCGPPADAPHHYVIDLVALDLAPDFLPQGLDREHVLAAIEGHSLGPASLVVRYRRQE